MITFLTSINVQMQVDSNTICACQNLNAELSYKH
jgi:hypothetical protein